VDLSFKPHYVMNEPKGPLRTSQCQPRVSITIHVHSQTQAE